MADKDKLYKVLDRYYKNQSTTAAVMAMYGAINSTTNVLNGDMSDENKIGVGQMLVDLTMGLQTNPFFMQFGQTLMPVFQMAVNAYVDHLEYFEKDRNTYPNVDDARMIETRSRILACSYVKHEIALAALLCEQGAGVLRQNSVALRDALIDLEKPE